MFANRDPQVLVVGAGPTGMAAALFLAKRNVPVRIIDEQWRGAAHSYALALHSRTLSLLDEVGATAELLRRGRRIDSVGFYDVRGKQAELRVSAPHAEFPYLLALRQDVFEDVLADQLRQAHVSIEWNQRLATLQPDADKVEATIEELEKASGGYAFSLTEWMIRRTRKLHPTFVVGADGHTSRVRQQLGIEYPAAGEPSAFAVFEFTTDADLGSELRVVLNADDSNAVWPLPDGACRWSFQIDPALLGHEARVKNRLAVEVGGGHYPHLTVDDLRGFLKERAPWWRGEIGEIRWSMAVRFEPHLAERFGEGRVWLAGDAAHMTGPVGMQSMNLGILEAHDLASRTARNLCGAATADQLEEYGDAHRATWQQLLGRAGSLAGGGDASLWIAQRAARLLPCLPASGDDLAHMLESLGLRMVDSAARRAPNPAPVRARA